MLAFPCMLIEPAKKAGMTVPSDADNFELEKETHIHFFVFCALQLGKGMRSPGEHWDNAKVIAEIPKEELMTMHLEDFIAKGFSY